MSLVLKDRVVVVIEADQTYSTAIMLGVQRRRLSSRVRQTKAPQVRLCQ